MSEVAITILLKVTFELPSFLRQGNFVLETIQFKISITNEFSHRFL